MSKHIGIMFSYSLPAGNCCMNSQSLKSLISF